MENYNKLGILELWSIWESIWYKVTEQEEWNSGCYPYYIHIKEYEYDGDMIDGVLFFADGTVEFHLKNARDAYYWSTFPIEVIIDVQNMVKNEINKK
jgi:hypothetical protein